MVWMLLIYWKLFFYGKMKCFSLFNKIVDWVIMFIRYMWCYFCNILMLCSLVMFIVLYYVKIINIIFIYVCFIIFVLDVILNICGFVCCFIILRFCRNDVYCKKGDLYGVCYEVMWCIFYFFLVLYGYG